MIPARVVILCVALIILAGCAARLDKLYVDAIRRSAVVAPSDVLKLRPLVADANGNVSVTSWVKCQTDAGPNRCFGYVPGPKTVKWDMWVVAEDEFRAACSTFRGDVALQLTQLVGLPAPRTPIEPAGYERQFVTLTAPIARVFRPCPDPRVDTDTCGTQLPASLPPNAPPDYYKWFTNQAMSAWRVPAEGQTPDGYPWTRLGYTYNWRPGAPSRYGVSEYVIPGASRATEVTVTSIRTIKDYCGTR